MFNILLPAKIQDFITLFLSMVVEAYPFVILGVLVSVVVGVFFKTEWINKFLPKNRYLSHLMLCFFGVLMPVCECGNIPVARRLLAKGLTVSQSMTFLLAAPILNPITFISTRDAFLHDPSILFYRMLGGFLVSYIVGILLSFKKNQEEWVSEKFLIECATEHTHDHDSKIRQSSEIFIAEFMSVMKMLVLGAFIAAASQSFIDRNILLQVGSNPVWSIVAMIVLSIVISICSNVDAFFALSYYDTFTKGSIVSFLVFGPMIDIKIMTMMNGVFKKKLLLIVFALVFMLTMAYGLFINYI